MVGQLFTVSWTVSLPLFTKAIELIERRTTLVTAACNLLHQSVLHMILFVLCWHAIGCQLLDLYITLFTASNAPRTLMKSIQTGPGLPSGGRQKGLHKYQIKFYCCSTIDSVAGGKCKEVVKAHHQTLGEYNIRRKNMHNSMRLAFE